MTTDLQQKFAPRRGNPRVHVKSSSSTIRKHAREVSEFELFHLCSELFHNLDREYRQFGFRLDQFVNRTEFISEARRELPFYEESKLSDCMSVYRFLRMTLNTWIGSRAAKLPNSRALAAEGFLK